MMIIIILTNDKGSGDDDTNKNNNNEDDDERGTMRDDETQRICETVAVDLKWDGTLQRMMKYNFSYSEVRCDHN